MISTKKRSLDFSGPFEKKPYKKIKSDGIKISNPKDNKNGIEKPKIAKGSQFKFSGKDNKFRNKQGQNLAEVKSGNKFKNDKKEVCR